MRTKTSDDIEVSQAAFAKLPALVSRAVFMQWTGYSDEMVSDGVKDGSIPVHRSHGKYGKYYKQTIAQICRLKF